MKLYIYWVILYLFIYVVLLVRLSNLGDLILLLTMALSGVCMGICINNKQ